MTITGELIGYERLTSKKGTDCFFAWVEVPFTSNGSGIGMKCESVCAFALDSSDLHSKVDKGKLLNKVVTCVGMRQGNSFVAVDIKPAS